MYNNWIKVDQNTGERTVIPKPKWYYSDGTRVSDDLLNAEGYYEIVDDPVPFEDLYTIDEVDPESAWEIIDNKCHVTRTRVEKDLESRATALQAYVTEELNLLKSSYDKTYFLFDIDDTGPQNIDISDDAFSFASASNFAFVKTPNNATIEVPPEKIDELQTEMVQAKGTIETFIAEKETFLSLYVRKEDVTDFEQHLTEIQDTINFSGDL